MLTKHIMDIRMECSFSNDALNIVHRFAITSGIQSPLEGESDDSQNDVIVRSFAGRLACVSGGGTFSELVGGCFYRVIGRHCWWWCLKFRWFGRSGILGKCTYILIFYCESMDQAGSHLGEASGWLLKKKIQKQLTISYIN